MVTFVKYQIMKRNTYLLIFTLVMMCMKVQAQDLTPGKNMVRSYIGELGKSEKLFLEGIKEKPTADTSFGFRRVYQAGLTSDFLQTAEFYFTGKGDYRLYEIILEFKDKATREAIVKELLGAPNYPGQEDHWILKGPRDITCVAWVFNSKLVVATALQDSEWVGEKLFEIPADYKITLSYKNNP